MRNNNDVSNFCAFFPPLKSVVGSMEATSSGVTAEIMNTTSLDRK